MKIMEDFAIAGRKVGPDYLRVVTAEVGINQNGEASKALELVAAAVEAGTGLSDFSATSPRWR